MKYLKYIFTGLVKFVLPLSIAIYMYIYLLNNFFIPTALVVGISGVLTFAYIIGKLLCKKE